MADAISNANVRHPALSHGTTVEIEDHIYLRDVKDYILDGEGTTIHYTGTAGIDAIIEVGSCLNCTIKNFTIYDYSGADAGVLVSNIVNKLGSSQCVFENIEIRYQDGTDPGPQYAFRVDYSILGGTNVNNDLHTFRHCMSSNHSTAGIYIKGTQAHLLTFDTVILTDYGNRNPKGLHAQSAGYFTARNCGFGDCSTDFYLVGPDTRITIDGFNSEHSEQFIRSSRVGAPSFIRINDVRWDGDPVSGTPVVDCFGDGPFLFSNGYLRGLNGVTPTMEFTHYGTNGRINYGGVDLNGWWIITHKESPPTGPEVYVPRTWSFRQAHCKHLTVTSGDWPRRNLKISRT